MSNSTLKVGIYPYLPDLAGDGLAGLRDYVKTQFEMQYPNITLDVHTDWDPYDVDNVAALLSDGADAYDVLEIDTILLGEVVDKNVLHPVVLGQFDLTKKLYPFGLDAVWYGDYYYGVPTLQCGNFLIELASKNATYKPNLLDPFEEGRWNMEDLMELVHTNRYSFNGYSPMVGNFRGSWTLPMAYLDTYINIHGRYSLRDGLTKPIDDTVVECLKRFTSLGNNSSTGVNNSTNEMYKDDPAQMVSDIAQSDHVLQFSYSEVASTTLFNADVEAKNFRVTSVSSPPQGPNNHLLAYTDAAVVNKTSYESEVKKDAIEKFITFYTSLEFRNHLTMGKYLPASNPPKRLYVLPSRMDFYTSGYGADDAYYQKLFSALDHAVAAPNHGLVGVKNTMNAALEQKLGYK